MKRNRYGYMVQWTKTHREHIKAKREEGRRKNPHYCAEYIRKWRRENPDKRRAGVLRVIKRHQEIKQEVLTHYGNGKCACVRCGESRLACLSIDHITGEGNQFRKETKLRTSNLYRYLKQMNYPKGFQTLCMNCQFVKRVENREYRKQ